MLSASEPHRELVSVGTPVARTRIRLVDRENSPVPEDPVGHIQVRGAAVTETGYDRHPEKRRRVPRPGGWRATGDLGLLYEGELYIVGRDKGQLPVLRRVKDQLGPRARTLAAASAGKVPLL